jgi:mannose-1-phosphate guanylyltransferase
LERGKIVNVLLLAAGEGTRFRPHTELVPKPALPFCGAPLMYYSYFLVKCLNPTKIVVNTYHIPSQIHRVGGALKNFGVPIEFSDETTLLGSAGGIAKAKSKLVGGGDFIAMNADEVIVPVKHEIMKDFFLYSRASNKLAVLMVMKHPEAGKKFGAVWVAESGRVIGFGKTRPLYEGRLVPFHFIGPMYFREKIFERIEEKPSNVLHDTLNQAIAEGEEIGIFPIKCGWFETGNLPDYLEATRSVLGLMRSGNPFLNDFHKQMIPEMELSVVKGAVLFKHVTAKVGAPLTAKGFIVLGKNSHLNASSLVEDIVCAENVVTFGEASLKSLLLLN